MTHATKVFLKLILVMSALSACDQWRDTSKSHKMPKPVISTVQKIKDSSQVMIGYREFSMPNSYVVNGQPVGYSLDVCTAIVDELKKTLNLPNLRVTYKAVTPSSRIPELLAGNIDMECGTTTNTLERQEKVAFSQNYYMTEVRMLVKKESGIHSITDLANKVVVTTQGTTSDKYIKQNERQAKVNVTNVFGRDNADSFAQVESGAAMAFFMDDNILAGLIANATHPDDFEIVGPILSTEPYAVMLNKNDPEMKNIADRAISNMIRSGAMLKSYQKWFQSPIPPKNTNLNWPINSSTKKLFAHPSDQGI